MSSGDPTKHDMSVDRTNEHISTKVYLMPESFNALRRELDEHYPNVFRWVGYNMVFNAQRFIHQMDSLLDTVTQFDSDNVDGICKRYLDELRVKRGVGRLHTEAEYGANVEMEESVRLARAMNEDGSWIKNKKH